MQLLHLCRHQEDAPQRMHTMRREPCLLHAMLPTQQDVQSTTRHAT